MMLYRLLHRIAMAAVMFVVLVGAGVVWARRARLAPRALAAPQAPSYTSTREPPANTGPVRAVDR
jgi:hypothetical protein